MLRDITIGQYYPADSVIHKLDPRTKLMGALLYIVSLFVFRGVAGFAAVTLTLIFIIALSKVPFGYMVRGLKAIVVILVITIVFNLFLTPGEPLVEFWKFRITWQGLENAGFMAVRLTYLILGSSVLTLTTTPNQLTDGMEQALKPLNKIRIPVHEISMMMSIALRFIPTLIEETDKIMSAQKARGADLETGGLMQRARALVPILIPLFVSSFRRADELALAMECRCYRGGEGRTRMKQLHMGPGDFVASALVVACLAGVIALNLLVK